MEGNLVIAIKIINFIFFKLVVWHSEVCIVTLHVQNVYKIANCNIFGTAKNYKQL